jgi:hypothetical protein
MIYTAAHNTSNYLADGARKTACTGLSDVDTNTELETAARSVPDEMRGCTGTSG